MGQELPLVHTDKRRNLREECGRQADANPRPVVRAVRSPGCRRRGACGAERPAFQPQDQYARRPSIAQHRIFFACAAALRARAEYEGSVVTASLRTRSALDNLLRIASTPASLRTDAARGVMGAQRATAAAAGTSTSAHPQGVRHVPHSAAHRALGALRTRSTLRGVLLALEHLAASTVPALPRADRRTFFRPAVRGDMGRGGWALAAAGPRRGGVATHAHTFF